MLIVNTNLSALNTANQLNINTNKKQKSVEKLSSGYRINKAADDTAGLAISEKMRYMIRGLNQGSKNVEDGISWVQTGDGALHEAHDILHRMTELTIQSLNDTNTELDRKALQMEFESLQSELDRIGQTTQFNDMPIFEEHEGPYYQSEGNIHWDPQQLHVVTAGDNDLTFTYRMDDASPTKTISISVPPGEYTTQELVDEIESVLGNASTGDEKIIFEYTPDGTCNVNLEGAQNLDCVSGGLSYLLNQVYRGGGFGALIGTTIFPNEYSQLEVKKDQNNFMSFTIEDFAGNKTQKDIDIPDGEYTRSELIDILNNQLAGTSVKATAYGTGIRLASDDSIVTGFKGNMFKIDGSGKIYDSVFYDNVKYGSSIQTAGIFTGGCVLPTNSKDEEHKYYYIDNNNNTLKLQPNGMASPVTVTINPGKYTASDIANTLNSSFALAGVGVKAEVITSGGFQGLKITSTEKGLNSAINMDATSSAYNTLFVTREYNQYGTQANITNETKADTDGIFYGSKNLLSLPIAPLTVTAGVNDSFNLSINNTDYTVSITAKTYNNIDDVVKELNERLNGTSAPMAYKGKVIASASDGKIVLTGQNGQTVDKIRVSINGNNGGFDEIFRGSKTTSTSQNVSGTGSVTLNTPFDGTINPSDSNLTINLDGKNHTVTLPTGNVSQDQIIDAIQNAIPPTTETKPHRFPAVSATGTTTDRNFSKTENGKQSSVFWSDSANGSSEKLEGVVGYIKNEPAQMTIGPALKDSMTVDDSNDKITITSNGKTETITLDHKTYTPDSLKLDLQNKINKVFGEAMGGVKVELKGNQLHLTSNLPEGANGAKTNLSCSTADSSFLKDLNTTKEPAKLTSSLPLASSISIDGSNNTFQFQLNEHGASKTVTLALSANTYSPSTLADEINRQLQQQNIAVTASVSNGKLMLKSEATGSDTSISYNTHFGGSSVEALFGPMSEKKPATAVVNMDTQPSITIEAGKTDQFTLAVNNTNVTVTLDSGTYDRDKFLEMLNNKLAGKGVTASYSGNKLQYQTTDSGSQTSIYMNYDYGGSAMKQIYGETTTTTPGITATFTPEGYLTLGSTDPNSKITISSSGGGAFQKPTITNVPIEPTFTDGYHSSKQSRVDGVALNGDITIDQWNDHLQFQFTDSGTPKTISFDIPQGTYTYTELQTKVQGLVDAQLGTAGTINVTVDASGVKLVAAKAGNKYKFSSFSGDFYDKVMCQCTEQSFAQNTQNKDGEQKVDPAYTVGRKDVKNEGADIRKGINDELSLDLTFGNQSQTIEVTLDQGRYSGDQLKNHLQEKINKQLSDLGFPENMIEVGLGDINSGISGSNDQNAINFKLSDKVKLPDEGEVIIDGVSGNAAFEIFYQTDGKMIPAYIVGTKDITEGVTIGPEDTDFSLEVDGVKYAITIPEGEYTADKLVDTINQAINASGAPLIASVDNNNLKISHKQMGEHKIDQIMGGAKDKVFFSENWDKEKKSGRYIQASSQQNDELILKRHVFNTAYLGINSVCISKPKYANKALDRLDQALNIISDIRSDFGSMQNRLGYTFDNNNNKSENTAAAESRLRDLNMASEMVQYASLNILEQVGQSMLAQAHKSQDRILMLLR